MLSTRHRLSYLGVSLWLCIAASIALAQDPAPAADPPAPQPSPDAAPQPPAEPRESENDESEGNVQGEGGANTAQGEAELPPVMAPKSADATNGSVDASGPLAGFAGDTAFLRAPDDSFVLFPSGRLQVDGYFYKRGSNAMPSSSVLLRRARLELAGWIGAWFFFNLAGDFASAPTTGANPVAQAWQSATDNFVGIAPFKDLVMLQVGQFDAPFTLENRTSDKYFDFMERSLTVRAFGVPTNKETGAMVFGTLPDKMAYYSVGVFNGEGQNYKNADNKYDMIGRAFVAPFSMAHVSALADVTLGASLWLGKRGAAGLPLPRQTTQGGFGFLDAGWKIPGPVSATPAELHQRGKLTAYGLELNVPLEHRYGVRAEYVHKVQELSVVDTTTQSANSAGMLLSDAKLKGWAAYGEAYLWLFGDDSILPAPGLESQPRLKGFEPKPPKHGLMLAARVDHIDERISTSVLIANDPLAGKHVITAYELGLNYWYSRRFRATVNYVRNHLSGTAAGLTNIKAVLGGKTDEHEFMLRLAVAL